MNCPYCGALAELTSSTRVYSGRDFGPIWCCPNWPACDSYVGVHRGTSRALGRMANAELRAWKVRAHAAFDGPCRHGRASRYRWLAARLGIPSAECHIGAFDVETCRRVVEECTNN